MEVSGERLEDWEIVRRPTGQDLGRFPDTETTSPDGNADAVRCSSRSEPQSTHESLHTSRSTTLASEALSADGDDLFPCKSCHSYHYIAECIYLLSWTEWLDYHSCRMPSQALPWDPSALVDKGQDPTLLLWERAQQLDENPRQHRPNFLANTRLKADLMTQSSRDMYWEEEKAKRKKSAKGPSVSRGAERSTLAWQSGLESEDKDGPDDDDEDEDDELALEDIRAEFGRHLPRTSWATPFRAV